MKWNWLLQYNEIFALKNTVILMKSLYGITSYSSYTSLEFSWLRIDDNRRELIYCPLKMEIHCSLVTKPPKFIFYTLFLTALTIHITYTVWDYDLNC